MAQKRAEDGTFAGKLTAKLHTKIVVDVEAGLFDAQIAYKNGIDVTTLKSWIDRGIDEDAEEPYKSFAEDYIKAAIALEERSLRTILDASEAWLKTKDVDEESRSASPGLDDDEPRGGFATKKSKRERTKERGDWKAAAWFLERRWPLRWGITRQPEGGPKESIKLPEATQNRRRRVTEMTKAPPPELIKAFRDAGYEIVRREETKA